MKQFMIYIDSLKCDIQFNVGENAEDNHSIIRLAKVDDLWFHIGGGKPSCHVTASIPITNAYSDSKNSKKGLKYIIKQGAVLCKSMSKYKSDKNVEIIYTFVKNVECSAEIPGRVTLSNYKTIVI
jgi:predicted ribosome quality control (RQC) complex YloA/Tae2 family protein